MGARVDLYRVTRHAQSLMTEQEAQQTTVRWLTEAGIGAGMRILEVGCGPGAVTSLLLDRVGETGEVVALDRDDGLLAIARERLQGRAVSFHRVDLEGVISEDLGSFDAVVGRRVLMYLSDPARVLGRLVQRLRAGGIVFFQELVLDEGPTGLPEHDAVRDWLIRLLRHESASWTMGRSLPRLFLEAGLPGPVMRAETDVVAPGQPDTLGARVRLILPRLLAAGLPVDGLEVDSLDARLRAERDAARQPWMAEHAVAAWARRA